MTTDLYSPISIKNMTLKNRIVMPPMCMYSARDQDGYTTDWHVSHYATRAIGGTGLIIIEMTNIEPDGRISNNCLGLWEDGQIEGIAKIVEACHAAGAKVAIQIAHAGRKATDAATPVSSSPIAFDSNSKTPHELTTSEIDLLINKYAESAKRAVKAGVDAIELHGAHGYLIHQFQSPLTNKRSDKYGENLGLFGERVISAVKNSIPAEMPLFLRTSAIEFHPEGYGLEHSLNLAADYLTAGIDVFHVSAGGESQNGPSATIGSDAGYQLGLAQAFKNKFNVPIIAVGNLSDAALSNSVITNNQADMIAVGRGLLRNPYWSLNTAAELHKQTDVPKQYSPAFPDIKN
ncbi:NADH:flavin oxidoreductase/NADH oxidase [Brochothrix thermosphacta]|uniref:NADH:flavin oxidoreductase/NADH oxidase n=1 Tax=Brochothrix thermosphacta TaxID=2756 RepID=UPI0039B10FC0